MGPSATVLQQLINTSLLIKNATKDAPQPTFEAHSPSVIPPSIHVSFPALPNPTSELRAMGVTELDAAKLVNMFHSACFQLQDIHRRELTKLLRQTTPRLHGALENSIKKVYLQNLEGMQSDLLQRTRRQCEALRASLASKSSARRGKDLSKPSFNHVSTSITLTALFYMFVRSC